jgi:hypothetical protein
MPFQEGISEEGQAKTNLTMPEAEGCIHHKQPSAAISLGVPAFSSSSSSSLASVPFADADVAAAPPPPPRPPPPSNAKSGTTLTMWQLSFFGLSEEEAMKLKHCLKMLGGEQKGDSHQYWI